MIRSQTIDEAIQASSFRFHVHPSCGVVPLPKKPDRVPCVGSITSSGSMGSFSSSSESVILILFFVIKIIIIIFFNAPREFRVVIRLRIGRYGAVGLQ
jgi:hypothetical protein